MAATPSSEARTGLKLISPTAIYVILLLAVPLATVLIYSVMTGGRGNVSLPLTIENYTELASKSVYAYILFKSLMVALAVTAITVVLAYPVAYFVSFHIKPERKSLWLFLITIPFWTSYIIRVSLWFVILGYDGVLDKTLMSLGIIDTQLNFSSYGIPAIIFVLAHAYAPFAVLPIFVSLEKVDRSLLEAGQDLGESRWATFLRVTLPLSMPGVIASSLIVFIPTVGDYVTPKLVGDGKQPLIANFIETQLLKLQNFPQGSAFAVVSMLMVAIVSVAFVLANKRFIGGQK
ncbi:MAG: ABC transporter permease [Tabrizicola sp.]|jgi:spermidine/putrescine transport system permease protein|nr:ABC transporter permease [Tabrizicola sp.]MCC6518344.1 ABC transporter permease [Tabrizicola sp.]